MKLHNRLRIGIAVILLGIWFGLASLGGPVFGKIADVSKNDQAAFLPSSAESTQVQQLQRRFESGKSVPAIVLLEAKAAFAPQQIASLAAVGGKFAAVDAVNDKVVGPIPSKDLKAIEFIVPVATDAELKEVVADLRQVAKDAAPDGVTAYVTGPAGLSADLSAAFAGIDGLLLVVALAAVFVILLVVYRSLLLPFLVLLNAMFALCAAILVVYALAKNGVIDLSGQSQGILFILVIGAATDYSLLLVSRYREALGRAADKWQAVVQGVKGSFEPILASAVTVILALLCLLFSDLNSNRSLGPIAATGIVFSLAATLTFLPALLALFGRAAFWPSKVTTGTSAEPPRISSGREELTGVWRRVGGLIAGHSRRVWVLVVVVLAVASLGLLQLKASGVPQTDLLLAESNAVDGQQALARHYSAGSSIPTLIAAPQDARDRVAQVVRSNDAVAEVTAYGESGRTPDLRQAKVVDGTVLLSASLTVDPYSAQAGAAVKQLRSELAGIQGVRVGGATAVALDTNNTATHDLRKIVPLVLLMIFVVLALLLRALVAPLILMGTVVLSFAATLGVSALVFNHIFGFPGADAAVPLFGFVFLVALGVDYNIFLVTRTREEALKYGTRAAILHSLGKTGGVITSAGIVLAATFAALGVIPILFLAQLAFIVAFGVLLDTVIVRSLLVPALFNDIGSKVWWPSKKLSKTDS